MSEITFKRFPENKQEQIRQFVSYAQMCGLSGADIRSIGDKLDRERKAVERRQNLEIVKGFECLAIGDDRRHRNHKSFFQQILDSRFKLKTARGDYNFKYDHYGWDIKSLSTGVTTRHQTEVYDYELPLSAGWDRKNRYALLLDINFGKLKLNF